MGRVHSCVLRPGVLCSVEITSIETRLCAHRLLDSVGLRESGPVRAAHLSGGQRRRLSVALAFSGDSRFVLLDEPTSGIDPTARRQIWDLIAKHREGACV